MSYVKNQEKQKPLSAIDIESWLITQVATRQKIPVQEVDPNRGLSDFGIDSLTAVDLVGDLETLTGKWLSATLLWEHPTIRALANHLVSEGE